MAVVSRLELNHPALGTAGGAGLHTSIEALYTKIGDNMNSRWYAISDFDQTETVDLQHNFEMDISLLRYDLWNYTGGEWVKVTATSSPALSAFSIIEKVGFEDTVLQITNNTGGNNLTFAVSIVNDPIYLSEGDVEDVDITTTTPEDGQALVFDSVSGKFKPGASGDSSLKVQSVTDPNAVIKGGYLLVGPSGKELATYDGAGSASTDFGGDITVNLDTILGGNPANATSYYLYIDMSSLSAAVTTSDTSRVLYGVTQSNLFLSTSSPEAIDRTRYVPLAMIRSATSGTVWSGAGSSFVTLAKFRHDVESSAVGAGGVNYIANPSAISNSDGAVATGTCTVTRSTTASELPRENFHTTAWKFAAGAANDYIRFRPKIGDADKNKQLLLSWAQKPESGFAPGDWDIEIYSADSGYTTFTAIPISDNDVPGGELVYQMPFTSGSADNYEIRFVRKAGSKYLVISDLFFGPKEPISIPNMKDFVRYDADLSVTGLGAGGLAQAYAGYSLSANMMTIMFNLHKDATPGTGAVNVEINLPPGYTIDTTLYPDTGNPVDTLGYATFYDNSTGDTYIFYATVNGGNIQFVRSDSAAAQFLVGSGFDANDYLYGILTFPVNESTSNIFSSNTTVEYAYNSDSSDANDTTSFAYGPQGGTVPSATGIRSKRVRFNSKITPTDIFKLQFNTVSQPDLWVDAGHIGYGLTVGTNDAGTVVYGVGYGQINSTDVDVVFFQYPTANAGTSWASYISALDIKNWRILKTSNPLTLGHKIVSQYSAGLMPDIHSSLDDAAATRLGLKQYLAGSSYNGGNTITIGGTAYTSTERGVFIPYQMQDGTWRCKINLVVVVSGDGTITVSSMTAKNVSGYTQFVPGTSFDGGATTQNSYISPNTNAITFNNTVGIAGDHMSFNADIELEAKPNWAY